MALSKILSSSLSAGVGGSLVKIASASYSSAVNTVTFTDCFTADYSDYKVIGSGFWGANAAEVYARVLDSGGSNITTWTSINMLSYTSNAGASGSSTILQYGSQNHYRFNDQTLASDNQHLLMFELNFSNPYESLYTVATGKTGIAASNNYIYNQDTTATLFSTTSARSLEIFTDNAANFAGYNVAIYGVTK